jgi:hypothetical protein
MKILRQGTVATIRLGPFVDSTDGNTEEGGLSLAAADIRLSKAGGDFGALHDSTAITHDEGGYYVVTLDDTDDTATLGRLRIASHPSGALPVWDDYLVVPAAVFDALAGAGTLPVNAQQWNGVDTGSGRPVLRLERIDADASGSSEPPLKLYSSDDVVIAQLEQGFLGATKAVLYLSGYGTGPVLRLYNETGEGILLDNSIPLGAAFSAAIAKSVLEAVLATYAAAGNTAQGITDAASAGSKPDVARIQTSTR